MRLDSLLGHRETVRGARREITRGTPLVAKLFGLPFVVFGGIATYAGLTHDMVDPDTGEAAAWWANALFVLLVGGTCLGFGLPAVLGRRGIVIDKDAGTLDRWWGLVFPMIRRGRKLGATKHVILGRVGRTSGALGSIHRRTRSLPGVLLDGPGDYTLDTFVREAAARRFAERAAATFDLPLEDRLLGEEARAAETLDEPLAARLRARGNVKLPDRPADSRVRIETEPGARRATLPPYGFDTAAAWLLLAAVVGGWAWSTFEMWTSGDPVDLLFGGAMTGVVLFIAWKLFGDLWVREEVLLTRDAVTVTRRLVGVPWWGTIPVAELEAVKFDDDAVRFVSDRRSLRLGGGHSEADCKYVAALVRAWLVEPTL